MEKTEYGYDEKQEREERAEKSCRVLVWSRSLGSGYFWLLLGCTTYILGTWFNFYELVYCKGRSLNKVIIFQPIFLDFLKPPWKFL